MAGKRSSEGAISLASVIESHTVFSRHVWEDRGHKKIEDPFCEVQELQVMNG